MADMKPIRLDKYLADMGAGTRSEVKNFVRKGLIRVNGETVKSPELKVDADRDIVEYNGRCVGYADFEYYMLNKPAGCVSATRDNVSETVLELIVDKKRKDLFPAGRLDKDTEGLLFITNDGDLAHRLLSPRHHVEKTYFALIDGMVTEEDRALFKEGVDIGEKELTLPADLKILTSGIQSEIELTITEGKFHQVKRMFEAVGKTVTYLKRVSMGGIALDPGLRPGEYRKLTEEELEILRSQDSADIQRRIEC